MPDDEILTGREPGISGEVPPEADVRLGGDKALLHAVEMLDHGDPRVRQRAAFQLAKAGDERALEALIELLYSGESRVIDVLWRFDDPRVREAIIWALDEVPPRYGMFYARYGFDTIERAVMRLEERVIPLLLERLNHAEEWRRAQAAHMLEEMGYGDFEETAVYLLDDSSAYIRIAALGVLARTKRADLQRPAIIQRLTSVMEHDPDRHVRRAAAEALEAIRAEG